MTFEQSLNAQARVTAFERAIYPRNLAPATVSFSTHGHLLIVGSEDMIRLAAAQLPDMGSVTLLVTEAVRKQDDVHLAQALSAVPELPLYHTPVQAVKGFLGQFQVMVNLDGQVVELAKLAQNRTVFDLILDLGDAPLFQAELAPAGYFHVAPESQSLADVISQLPEYVGEFEKPRYFQVNNDICAHSSRGQTGCTRCLDVCPADAITSIQDLISIDPYLCHGAGGCATACPTGAIRYALPQPTQLLGYIAKLLQSYQDAGGVQPVVLFYDHEQGRDIVDRVRTQLPDSWLAVEIEEVAAAGQEVWFSALALGAQQVLLLDTPAVPESIRTLLNNETDLAQMLLSGLSYNSQQIALTDEAGLVEPLPLCGLYQPPVAELALSSDKREALFDALDHLITHAPGALPDSLALPAGSPYGHVTVDNKDCTLCMSCVAVCPSQALTDGGEKPALLFTEQNCVQCGLCERACPEDAIKLTPRLLLDDSRQQRVELMADTPFECISCGAEFAPKRTIEKMLAKLSGHPYFQGDAIQRLKMCEDCRVKDIYSDLSANPEKQLEL